MNSDRFVKVFDILDSGFKDWSFSAFGLIFVAIGIAVAVFPTIVRAIGIPFIELGGLRKVFRYSFVSFAVLWTIIAFTGTFSSYLRHKSLAQQDACRVVEGLIQNFVPMPYGGHANESFTVGGVRFQYSDFIVTDSFNNTASHGGPISRDAYVRICYDPSDHAILRLEIRDFKGERRKDAERWSFSPVMEVRPTNNAPPRVQIPWYGDFVLPLFLADIVAIQALFLPYLRTFVCIRRLTVRSIVPQGLEPDKNVKLANSMIYWDRVDHAIWLRPRGFNLIQIPLIVARLNVNADDRTIVGAELRFSLGFPFLLLLLLLVAYQFFSAVMRGDNGPPVGILFGFGPLIILVGVINILILRSRMQKLLQDALSEIDEM